MAAALLFCAAGWLLVTRRRDSAVGYAALLAGLANAVGVTGAEWVILSRIGHHHLPASDCALWLASWPFAVEPIVLLVFYWLFPDGHRPPGRWGAVAAVPVLMCLVGLAQSVLAPLSPDPQGPFSDLRNPLSVKGLPNLDALIGLGLLLGSAILVVRWLSSGPEDRRPFRTLALVALVGFGLPVLPISTPAARLLYELHSLVLLLVVLWAVLRHQLFGVHVVVNRTLVYLASTALIAGIYAGLVALAASFGWTASGARNTLAAVVAALCLLPARDLLQRLVNRLLYGYRDDPFAVIAAIAEHVEPSVDPEHVLEGLLHTIMEALHLPAAVLSLPDASGGAQQISVGEGSGPVDRFPLVHQGETLGDLLVTRRHGQGDLTPDERRLLTHVARQAAAAARAVALQGQLARSRERIVGAAEDERRRLRRDLHDGLGPVLTAAASRIDACVGFLTREPARVEHLLAQTRQDLTVGLDDLRRLINSLRPVVLDELGLLGALRQLCERSIVATCAKLPEQLPPLPAAVEVTAYRIVSEALTNVTRHANASRCEVRLEVRDQLLIEVTDDGDNPVPWRPGVGLSSMRERATELGGSWAAGPTPAGPGGTGGTVRASLPLVLVGVPA